MLIKHRAPPSMLSLEITESLIMSDPDGSARSLAELHEMGVRIVIDDFGTGYSSLSYLRRLPVDELKIDRSFILGLSEGEDDTLVRCLIDLAHNLGLRVVAEGVETAGGVPAADRAWLRRRAGLLHQPARARQRDRRLDHQAAGLFSPGPRVRHPARVGRRPRYLQSTRPIHYPLEVMSLVHHAHRSHHHRSQNGTAGVCA